MGQYPGTQFLYTYELAGFFKIIYMYLCTYKNYFNMYMSCILFLQVTTRHFGLAHKGMFVLYAGELKSQNFNVKSNS